MRLRQISNRGRAVRAAHGATCREHLASLELFQYSKFVFVSFEESSDELSDNVRPLGFDLDGLVKRKQLAAIDSVKHPRSSSMRRFEALQLLASCRQQESFRQ
jgi:KaiC/GvpD/RAD55 family RecA-like ATPase